MMNRREVPTGAVVTTVRSAKAGQGELRQLFSRIRYGARRQFEPLRFLLTVCGTEHVLVSVPKPCYQS
jgi:hypothetical protein